MAQPLMSLLNSAPMKSVVPWKNRQEFLSVLNDLISGSEEKEKEVVKKINMWKSRVGSKLSVAIDNTASLLQASLSHRQADREGVLATDESRQWQLRAEYSLALVRFVNHITEKGQNKAVAQPVHLVAREFGIPDWIVKLRHDATHATLPSLDTLCAATTWALDYLKENFWKQQTSDNTENTVATKSRSHRPKLQEIRTVFYNFQKARFNELNNAKDDIETNKRNRLEEVENLLKLLKQDKTRFLKCFVEDGILITTEEQLEAFGMSKEELLVQLPPVVPLEIIRLWRPLIQKLHEEASLRALLETMMFSVDSDINLRNYQLVGWVLFILTQTKGHKQRTKPSRKKAIFSKRVSVAKHIVLQSCLQNINSLTVYLLPYLADKSSLGEYRYDKLEQLMKIPGSYQNKKGGSEYSQDEDSDTIYTVEDVKNAKTENSEKQISSTTVQDLQENFSMPQIQWNICTDIVDWSTVPLGHLPRLEDEIEENDTSSEEEDEGKNDKTDDTQWKGSSSSGEDSSGKRGRRKHSDEETSQHDDSENSLSPSPKKTKFEAKDLDI